MKKDTRLPEPHPHDLKNCPLFAHRYCMDCGNNPQIPNRENQLRARFYLSLALNNPEISRRLPKYLFSRCEDCYNLTGFSRRDQVLAQEIQSEFPNHQYQDL